MLRNYKGLCLPFRLSFDVCSYSIERASQKKRSNSTFRFEMAISSKDVFGVCLLLTTKEIVDQSRLDDLVILRDHNTAGISSLAVDILEAPNLPSNCG